MRKIILTIFTVFLLASCAMEDVSNSYNDSEIGVRAADEVTFDKDCFFRKVVLWSETEAAHAVGIQGPGLKDGSFGSPWAGN